MFKCRECLFMFKFKGNLKRHKESMHEGVHYSCYLCTKTFGFASSVSRHIRNVHGVDANPKLYRRQVTGLNNDEDNVPDERVRHSCDLCNSTFHNRSNLLRHIRHSHGVDACQRHYKKNLGTAQDRVRYSCYVCSKTFGFRSSVSRHIKKTHGTAAMQRNYMMTQGGVQDRVRYSCHLCTKTYSFTSSVSRHIKNVHGNDTFDKNRVTIQKDVPDIQSESHVIYISSDSEDCEIYTEPLIEDSCSTSPTTVNVEKTSIDNSVGTKTTRFNLRSHNPLGVVHQNEYLPKGTKNQSFSTPQKRCILRELHEEYVKAENIQDRRLAWASHATSLSKKLNLELKVIGMLMLDVPTDYSTPVDENLIQMLHQDSLFCVENIQHHSQYYIFVHLVHGLMKVYEIDSEDLQSRRKSNWMKNTITILEYFKFTNDIADFMIERMENFF